MHRRFDLNKLYDFCRHYALGFTASYQESSDELEIRITSAAKSEEMYMKRVPTIDYLIEKWHEQTHEKR